MLYLLANNGLLSGRASGNVYQKNGRVRAFKVPALVQNTATATVRNRFGSNSSAWNGLDDGERASWNSASGFYTSDRFGRTISLVGKALYTSLSNNLDAIGYSPNSVAPLPAEVDVFISVDITSFDASAMTLALNYEPDPWPATSSVLVFATAPQSAGTSKPSSGKYRIISYIKDGDTPQLVLGSSYVSRFGVPPVGSKIFVKLLIINTATGQAGVPIFLTSVVVA